MSAYSKEALQAAQDFMSDPALHDAAMDEGLFNLAISTFAAGYDQCIRDKAKEEDNQ